MIWPYVKTVDTLYQPGDHIELHQIGQDELCDDCKATLKIREDNGMMAWLRRCGIKVD
jgi:hypothetical protein